MDRSQALRLLIANLKQIPEEIRIWIKTDAKYFAIAFGSLIAFKFLIGL